MGLLNFYYKVSDRLTSQEKEEFKYLIDSIFWIEYEKGMINSLSTYEISLIDGSEFKGVRFRFNEETQCFESDTPIDHPQAIFRENIRIKIWGVPDTIVKYIKW